MKLSAFVAVVLGLALVLSAAPAGAQTTTIALSFTDTTDSVLTAVGEDGGAQTVRVVATASSAVSSSVSVTVTVGASGGTATAGSCAGSGCTGDYEVSAASVTVTIASGGTSGSADVMVTPFSDTVTEDHETVRFTGTASGYTVTQADLQITDADRTITLTWDDPLFPETEAASGSNVQFLYRVKMLTGALSGATSTYSSAINAQVRLVQGTASSADIGWNHESPFFPSLNKYVNIPAGDVKSGVVTEMSFHLFDDTIAEPDEFFYMGLDAVPGFTVVRAQSTIVDADSVVRLTPDPAGLGEGGSGSGVAVSASFVSTRGDASTSSVHTADTVTALSVSSGTAGSADFSYAPSAPNTVTIPAGAVSSTTPAALAGLRVADDNLFEGPETLLLGGDLLEGPESLRSSGGLAGYEDDNDLVIIDGDARIGLRLLNAAGGPISSMGEGSSGTVWVRAGMPPGFSSADPITVRVRVEGVHPTTAGEDYAPVAPFDIVIPAGARSAMVSFAFDASGAYDDSVFEGGGRLAVTGTTTAFFAVAPTRLWIYENDSDPDPADRGGPPGPTGCEGRFCDDDDSVHQPAIEQISEWEITTGCNPGDPDLFCPNRQVTRAQMAAFLYRAVARAAGGDPPAPGGVELSDVAADAWYRAYAQWAVSAGVFAAPGGEFNPNAAVTRADMAAMLVAAFDHLNPPSRDPAVRGIFADMGGQDRETQLAAESLHQAGVTRGCASAPLRYCPDRPVTRAQMATFIVRALNIDPAAI